MQYILNKRILKFVSPQINKLKLKSEHDVHITKSKFLWLPKIINGKFKWLEQATWKEKPFTYIDDPQFQIKWLSIDWIE